MSTLSPQQLKCGVLCQRLVSKFQMQNPVALCDLEVKFEMKGPFPYSSSWLRKNLLFSKYINNYFWIFTLMDFQVGQLRVSLDTAQFLCVFSTIQLFGLKVPFFEFQFCMHACLSCLSGVRLFAIPTIAHQVPLGFSRQEYWSGLPYPPLWNLPNSGIALTSLMSPALASRVFTTSSTWENLNNPHKTFHGACFYFAKERKKFHGYQ